ncbi:MAG: hypothetical protein O3A36_01360 [bacterium]|nr:hypothetical protein [bacterium]
MKQLFRILIYVFCLSLLVGGIVYVHIHVSVLWRDAELRLVQLLDVPAQTSHTTALKKRFDLASAEMDTIYAAIPTRDELVAVVAAISAEAIRSGISAQVPIVQTAKIPEEGTAPTRFEDVRIQIVASGQPAALALFLHRVEHLLYILHLASWKIDTMQKSSVTPFTSEVLSGEQVAPPLSTSLEASISLIIQNKPLTP